ncbi:superinfection immunity protein [Streptomyces sp. NPDC050600]|uniref:superinfection immunity protein n=1 Tax=Streptomyces sp. NPDC050600 TaxID=3157213 RepID=UPI003418F60B
MSCSMLVPTVIVLALPYFVPTVVAVVRSVPNRGSVIVINVFLGWTVLGWIVALAMAARSGPPRPPRDSCPPRDSNRGPLRQWASALARPVRTRMGTARAHDPSCWPSPGLLH